VVVTIGSEDLLGPQLWVGNIGVPYPEAAPGPYKLASALSATDLAHTVRYAFDDGVIAEGRGETLEIPAGTPVFMAELER